MKELIRVRAQYALRQQCCKTHKRPLPLPCTETKYIENNYTYEGRNSEMDIATVRGLNPSGDEIFCTRPDRSWGPHIALYRGYEVYVFLVTIY